MSHNWWKYSLILFSWIVFPPANSSLFLPLRFQSKILQIARSSHSNPNPNLLLLKASFHVPVLLQQDCQPAKIYEPMERNWDTIYCQQFPKNLLEKHWQNNHDWLPKNNMNQIEEHISQDYSWKDQHFALLQTATCVLPFYSESFIPLQGFIVLKIRHDIISIIHKSTTVRIPFRFFWVIARE